MPKPKKEIVVAQQNNTVESFIQTAITNNAPVETMERLFALHKEVQAERAKGEYVRALADFQKDCPVIEKTKRVMNKDGKTVRYKFAPIDSIVSQIKNPIATANLSYRWEVENTPGMIKANCIVTHVNGHSETSSFEVPVEKSDYMTSPQSYASALTFAKRYSLLNALGIATADEDTDATDVRKKKDSPISDKSKIVFLLKKLNQDISTAESVKEAVHNLVDLELVESNYVEIISRLEIVVKEREEYDQSIEI